jgi:hypothetical protein
VSDDYTEARDRRFETRFTHVSEIVQPALASRRHSASRTIRALPFLKATCVFFSLRICWITTACESCHILQLRS